MSLHRRNEPWLRMSRVRRKSLMKNLAAEVLEPRCLLTDTTGTLANDTPPLLEDYANEDLWLVDFREWLTAVGAGPGESSDSADDTGVDSGSTNGGSRASDSGLFDAGAHPDPNAEPIPGNYANQELWLAAYEQWLIDQGFISEPTSEPNTVNGSETNDSAPLLEDYANEDLWLVDYQQWLIAVGAGPGESSDSTSGDDVVADVGGKDEIPALSNSILLIGQGIAPVGIQDRELAQLDTDNSDAESRPLADTTPDDDLGSDVFGFADDAELASDTDASSANLSDELSLGLDAALSNELLASLTKTLPPTPGF